MAVLLLVAMAVASCANIGNPEGGPRDYTPPVMLRSNPAPGAVNFKGKKVEIYFDEIVNIKDQTTRVVVSPAPKEQPAIRAQGKKITVEFQEDLLPGTTYVIDFTDAIEDNNEANVLDGFSFAFSTGDHVDSLQVSGIVLRASDLEPMRNVLVGLHSNLDDSAFTTLPLERVSRTNSFGQFTLRNIAPGDYHIFALRDADGDYKMARSEDIAFLDRVIVPSTQEYASQDTVFTFDHKVDTIVSATHTEFLPNDLLLSLFNEDYRSLYFKKNERLGNNKLLTLFSAPMPEMPTARALSPQPMLDEWYKLETREAQDSLVYWLTDSLFIKADSPIERIDMSGIHLEKMNSDSTWTPVEVPTMVQASPWDVFRYVAPKRLEQNTDYRLTIDSLAVTSIYGIACDTIKTKFKVKSEEEYANLHVNCLGFEGSKAFAMLLDKNGRTLRKVDVLEQYADFYDLLPDVYYVMMVLDANGNGRWDTGNYSQHLQPEEVFYYHNPIKLKKFSDITLTWNIYDVAVDKQKPDAIRKIHPEERNTKLKKNDNKKKTDDEEDEDEFNSNGFMNNSTYSGNKYDDVKRGVVR